MYPVIDMHCDTIYSISNLRQAGTPACLRGNDLHIDLLRMKQSGYLCQSFALFSYLQGLRENGIDPFDYALSLSDLLDEELAANADLIRPVLSASEMISNHEAGMMSALKTIEEGGVYKGDPELVRFFL